jgi:hypothetical protein
MSSDLIMKEWQAVGFTWRLLRSRRCPWFYLERDGRVIAEGSDRKNLLSQGWYYGTRHRVTLD